MITQQLLDFIKNQQINGIATDAITATLINNGWKPEDIQEGFNEAAKIGAKPTPSPDSTGLPQQSGQATAQSGSVQTVTTQPAPTQPATTPFANVSPAQQEWMMKQGGATDTSAFMSSTQTAPPVMQPTSQPTQPQITYQPPKKSGGGKTCLIIGLIVGGLGCLTLIVIGILSAGIIAAINPAAQLDKARLVQNRNNFSEMQNALARYFADKNVYPATLEDLVNEGQINKIPDDPETQEPYVYTLSSGSLDYQLCTSAGATKHTCLTKDSVPGEIFINPTPRK